MKYAGRHRSCFACLSIFHSMPILPPRRGLSPSFAPLLSSAPPYSLVSHDPSPYHKSPNTYFNCTEKSSVVSSSSQLSSHRCVFVPCAPTSSSFAQSITHQHHVHIILHQQFPDIFCLPSTGKSSNSSSSSSCAAGFCGWRGLESSLESETVALAVATLLPVASDILAVDLIGRCMSLFRLSCWYRSYIRK